MDEGIGRLHGNEQLWRNMAMILIMMMITFVGSSPPSRNHGQIVMGTNDSTCDDGKSHLEVDWATDDTSYQCHASERIFPVTPTVPIWSCLDNDDIPFPTHICMDEKIAYKDDPPRGGPHRPHWPVYGEYIYIPPQRWIHSMEHGGVVFLYHPCADPGSIKQTATILKQCIRRHIITPYRNLTLEQPLALVTYGCRLTFSQIDVQLITKFIQENAINPAHSSESAVWRDGTYNYGLKEKAKIITGSDEKDSNLCTQPITLGAK